MIIMEVCDPFMESIRINYGAGSRVEERWNKLFNNVGSLVRKYETIEDYPMGVYHLCFYLNNGRALRQDVEMIYFKYSYNNGEPLRRLADEIEDKICREGRVFYDYWTLLDDAKLGWKQKPIADWKREWEAKWDSAKEILNKKYGYLSTDKEDKVMTYYEYEMMMAERKPEIKDVIFNDPATIVKWADGTKTVVKVQKGEPYDEEKGLAMAYIKKIYDNKGNYNDIFRKWCPKKEISKVDDFNGTVEEMFEDLFADDFECESCKIDV